jgi:VWFA-related protein
MKRSWILAAIAAGLVRPLAAQPQQTPPNYRAGTAVVQVDVIVRDKDGRFVTDLAPQDFQVSEDGTPQTVSQFYVVVGPEAPAASAPAPQPPGRPAPAGPPAVQFPRAPRLFIVVFDDDHLSPGGFKRVQAAALSLFEKQFQKGDVGGVVANGKMANNRLTSDREELLKAVRAAKPSGRTLFRLAEERDWPRMSLAEAVRIRVDNDQQLLRAVAIRACNDEPDACQRDDATSTVLEKSARMAAEAATQTNATLRTLAVLMNGLARFEGRKSILLLTEGFVAEESWPLVKEAVGLAARGHATIYTLDARGLDSTNMESHLMGSDPGALDREGRLLNQFDMGSDSVNSLAVDTGGFVVRNTNIFDQAVARIADDASHYYVLGYRPVKAPDGKFRKISVKVERPGLSVRARRGYVAATEPVPTMTEAAKAEADAAGPASPAPAAAPVRAAPSASPAAPAAPVPAAPAAGTVVPNAGGAGGSAWHLRPNASEHVEKLATNAPDPDADKGWSAYQRGDLEAARTSLAAAAARPTARPWVRYALGQSEYALGHYDRAVVEWEAVRKNVPEFQPVYFDLVDGYIQLHDPDKATKVLHAARDRWPKDAEVYEALGVVQTTRGALDDAIDSFQKAIAVAPEDPIGYFNLAKALELRYVRTRRFIERTRTWMASSTDRENAIANYKKYLAMGGGPFANSARDGLTRLNWEADKVK